MALFHLSVTQTKRNAGQSAIASAAYRAGERLYSEYYGEYSDYTRKGGVICSDILLPSHAPPEYADRQTLWNAVEKAERGKNAQLAYSFDIALQNEFSLEENIALARQFLLENFVSRGMVVDFAVHQPDREDGGIPNPHFHVLCPIRPIEQNGKWGLKQRRVYELDEDGNRIRDANGKFVFNAVPTTDWGSPETLEHWREAWAELCNAKFAEKGLDVRIDHRSYERQGVELLPTVHEGATVRAMEKKGIRTEKGEFNRWIKATNYNTGHITLREEREIQEFENYALSYVFRFNSLQLLILCWDRDIKEDVLNKNNIILKYQYPYSILDASGNTVLSRCTSEATYHHEQLIDVTWGQGLMDEISYMRGTFSEQSEKYFEEVQKRWDEEERKLAEEHPR